MRERIEKYIEIILEVFWLLIIFLIPIYFNWYHSYSVFELGKIVVFRVLVEIMLLFFLLKILFFKLKTKVYFKKLLPFFAFFLVVSLATFFSSHFYISFWGSFFRYLGLFSLFHYFIFFLILVFCLKTEAQIKRIILAVLFSSLVVCLYACLQIFGLDLFSWSEEGLRATSTFGQPNFLGSFLILVFPLTIAGFKFWQSSLMRLFLIVSGLLQIFVLIFTFSRSSWLGFLGAIFFLLAFYFYLAGKRKSRLLIYLIIFLSLLASIFLISNNYLVNSDNLFFSRIASVVDFNAPTAKIRLLYWKAAPQIIKEWPVLGYGPDTQIFPFVEHYSPEASIYEAINSHPDRAHNEILDILITTGILGLISYLFLIGGIFYQGLKKKSFFAAILLSALFGHFIANQFGFFTIADLLYFWLILALITIIVNKDNQEKEYRLNFSLISKLLILSAFLGASFILIKYKNINLLIADYHFYQSRKEVRDKELVKLLDRYEEIYKYNFYESYYYRQEAEDVLNLTAKFKDKNLKKDILEIVFKNFNDIPEDTQAIEFLLLKGQLLSAYGEIEPAKFEEAEEVFLKLSQTAPRMAVIYNDWGRMYLLKKDYEKAIEKLEKALILYPINHPDIDCCNRRSQIEKEMSVVYHNLGDVYFFQKDYQKAIENYESGLKLQPLEPLFHKKLADVYYLEGNLEQAIKENLNGLRLEPKNKDWYENLILLYQEKKDLKKVKEYQDKISKL
ncbi:MAG: hypothetical protein Athens101410_463 [Parcubacteria group bacterium Athens1014_10]|nr:MAG: hypothetical protein Athens101410_463 [Parcubacteria group bacterium Athens1014_10]TSD05228.1 MAG: hypothetical protein Athens071412_426 [Parcubacteria group bacterium Athens0714_12]